MGNHKKHLLGSGFTLHSQEVFFNQVFRGGLIGVCWERQHFKSLKTGWGGPGSMKWPGHELLKQKHCPISLIFTLYTRGSSAFNRNPVQTTAPHWWFYYPFQAGPWQSHQESVGQRQYRSDLPKLAAMISFLSLGETEVSWSAATAMVADKVLFGTGGMAKQCSLRQWMQISISLRDDWIQLDRWALGLQPAGQHDVGVNLVYLE